MNDLKDCEGIGSILACQEDEAPAYGGREDDLEGETPSLGLGEEAPVHHPYLLL